MFTFVALWTGALLGRGVEKVEAVHWHEELGIAQSVVIVGFGITFGGVVFATCLAFGLGAKDLAKDYLERTLSNRPRDRAPDDLRHL